MADDSLIDVRQVISDTCRAYQSRAIEYAEATAAYEPFPALRGQVLAFEKSAPPGRPILDLGSGGGRDSRLLAGLRRQVVAGDMCDGLLRRVRVQSAGQPIGCVRLDMLALPFRDGVFGGVWACGSILHLPSQAFGGVLAEVSRTLVPGGLACISMRAGDREGWRDGGTLPGRRWFTFVDPDGFAATMSAAGFGDVDVTFTGRDTWFLASGYR